ncbi:hypothetical protein EPUL_002895, partial [Erysiphe pulchra]
MATPNSNRVLLCSAFHTPIAQLSPALESIGSRSIEAVVTLTWPYSSSSNSITFLFSEPDFRLRNSRGQVRVEFSGPSGKSVVKAGVSSGDRVILSLEGVEWIQDDSSPLIPGRGIEFKLKFTDKTFLQFQSEGSDDVREIHVDYPLEEDLSLDPKSAVASNLESLSGSSNNLDQPVTIKENYGNHLYSSPAFLKRARTSYGSLFDSELDTFIEVDGSIQGKGRKKSRLSLTWGYRSPSPDLEREETKENVSIDAIENIFKPVKSVMIDEGIQTNEDISIEITGQSITKPVANDGSLSIPITTHNLIREKLAIKEHHLLTVDENEIKNNQHSDIMPTEDIPVKSLNSPQNSPIPAENHTQEPILPIIEQSSISGNFLSANTQPIVRGSEFSPVICTDEVKNRLNDSNSDGSIQSKNIIQNSPTNVTLSRQETCSSSPKFEEENAPGYVSLNPSSDSNMIEPQLNSSLTGNFMSKPQDGEKSTVENIDNVDIRFSDASSDQDLTKDVELTVQGFNSSKTTNYDQVQSLAAVKSGIELQQNVVAASLSPSPVATSTSDSGCLIEHLNTIKEDDNDSISVETNRSLNRYEIPPVSDNESEIISTGISEGHMNSSLYQGSENENHEQQGDIYQGLTDYESHGYDENYNNQYDEEMIGEEDSRFSHTFDDSREEREKDSLSESETYRYNKELPTYIDLVSSDDENESSTSAKIPVDPELESFRSEIITKDFDENDKAKAKEVEKTEVGEEGEDKLKVEEDEEREGEEMEKTEELEGIKDLKEAEVVEEIKELEKIKEIREVEEILEIKEIQEAEAVEEMGEIEKAGEMEELKEIEEAKEIENAEEMGEAEDMEELEETEEAEGVIVMEEVGKMGNVDEIEESEEMEELEETEETEETEEAEETEEEEETEEAEETKEAEETEEAEEVIVIEEVEEMENAEEVKQIKKSEKVEEIEEAKEIENAEEMGEAEEVKEAEDMI